MVPVNLSSMIVRFFEREQILQLKVGCPIGICVFGVTRAAISVT